jgi:hypothetical protein
MPKDDYRRQESYVIYYVETRDNMLTFFIISRKSKNYLARQLFRSTNWNAACESYIEVVIEFFFAY